MRAVTVEQAWSIASDTAGLQAVADEFGQTATQVVKFGEEVSEQASKLDEVADAMETQAIRGAAQLGVVCTKGDFLTTALISIGAEEQADTTTNLAAFCEEQLDVIAARCKDVDTITRDAVRKLSRDRKHIDAVASSVSAARTRVVDAL